MPRDEQDYRQRVSPEAPTRFLAGTSIEIVRELPAGRTPQFALFDFDGTLSLIRAGWADVMIPMMVEILDATGAGELIDELERLVTDFVQQLNGKQTIYQMIRLAEEVARRGGEAADPLVYKRAYHERLMEKIGARREALRSGAQRPAAWLVPGTEDLLTALAERGIELYLASGTDVGYVREEAALLGIDRFFGDRIYGALDDYRNFSKEMVIRQILDERRIGGDALLGFGDGYVEIDNVKTAGGAAVAVASDEGQRGGRPDAWKRARLIGVGADVVIPDYREWRELLEYLLG